MKLSSSTENERSLTRRLSPILLILSGQAAFLLAAVVMISRASAELAVSMPGLLANIVALIIGPLVWLAQRRKTLETSQLSGGVGLCFAAAILTVAVSAVVMRADGDIKKNTIC